MSRFGRSPQNILGSETDFLTRCANAPLLLWNHHFFVVFVSQTESWPSNWQNLKSLYVRSRSRVLSHIPLHPFWKQSFWTKSESKPFFLVRIEGCNNTVRWFSTVSRMAAEPLSFRETIRVIAPLESHYVIFVKKIWIQTKILSFNCRIKDIF